MSSSRDFAVPTFTSRRKCKRFWIFGECKLIQRQTALLVRRLLGCIEKRRISTFSAMQEKITFYTTRYFWFRLLPFSSTTKVTLFRYYNYTKSDILCRYTYYYLFHHRIVNENTEQIFVSYHYCERYTVRFRMCFTFFVLVFTSENKVNTYFCTCKNGLTLRQNKEK